MKPLIGYGDRAQFLERLAFEVSQETAGETGTRLFEALVRDLAQALPADFVFAGALKPGARRIVALASFSEAGEPPPREFDLAETPFWDVSAERPEPFSYPVSAAQRFPGDPLLRQVPGDGYVGMPLLDPTGNLIGLLSAITRRRLEDPQLAEEVIRVFAAPARKELERAKHSASLESESLASESLGSKSVQRQPVELRAAEKEEEKQEEAPAKPHLDRDKAYLREEIDAVYPPAIGESPEFRNLMGHIRRAAGVSSIVLIQGESGSGKELAARAIHNLSARRNRPLVKLDCAALPPEALELELFGGLRAALPDAAPRIGRLDLADGGTLLIDEVAALPPDLQAKLLRVLQQREFRPLGSQRTVKIDIRLLLTTNQDLDRAVEEGRFRSDLHQRLLADPLRVPPLRRRRPDIPLLTDQHLRILKSRFGREDLSVSARMMNQMMSYAWPGNIRELKDLLFRAAASLPSSSGEAELDLPVQTESTSPEPVTLEEAERHHVNRTLASCNWVIEGLRGAAAVLDVPPSTLRSLMKRLRIQRAGKAVS